jgi:hypothetical protein
LSEGPNTPLAKIDSWLPVGLNQLTNLHRFQIFIDGFQRLSSRLGGKPKTLLK